jgi:hypothetical protein
LGWRWAPQLRTKALICLEVVTDTYVTISASMHIVITCINKCVSVLWAKNIFHKRNLQLTGGCPVKKKKEKKKSKDVSSTHPKINITSSIHHPGWRKPPS